MREREQEYNSIVKKKIKILLTHWHLQLWYQCNCILFCFVIFFISVSFQSVANDSLG